MLAVYKKDIISHRALFWQLTDSPCSAHVLVFFSTSFSLIQIHYKATNSKVVLLGQQRWHHAPQQSRLHHVCAASKLELIIAYSHARFLLQQSGWRSEKARWQTHTWSKSPLQMASLKTLCFDMVLLGEPQSLLLPLNTRVQNFRKRASLSWPYWKHMAGEKAGKPPFN